VAALRGVDIDISFSTKDLVGERTFAEATARAAATITGKVASGRFDGRAVGQLFFNEEPTEGRIELVSEKRQAVPATTPFTVNVIGVGETFDSDLGVVDGATGGFFDRVDDAGDLVPGKYLVSGGTYTFDEDDAGKTVLVSFMRGVSGGSTTLITNQMMDIAPTFELVSADSKGMMIQLYACTFSKLTLQRKNDDFLIPNMEFGAYADDIRGVGRLSGVV